MQIPSQAGKMLQQMKWWDKCIAVHQQPFHQQPEALLYSENGHRISKLDIPPSPFRQPLDRKLPRCGSIWFTLWGSVLFAVFLLLVRHLLQFWDGGVVVHRHYEQKFVAGVSNESLSAHLRKLTRSPHVAGTREDFDTAEHVYASFATYGINAHFADYNVLLTYPVQRNLALVGVDGSVEGFSLKEDDVEEDPDTKNPKIISTFHAYSPSGNVSGEVVYANYGRKEDFDTLLRFGVDLTGAVVVARYGEIYRGDVVHNAALLGAAGVIIFSDPLNYAANNSQGYYPDSPWLPPSGVQRGSLFRGIGDPLTPGWAATPGAEQVEIDDAGLPTIPSLPISGRDAEKILLSLSGPSAPSGWHGALHPDCYRIGRGPARLNLTYVAKQGVSPIRNVIGVIEGSEEPDRYVVVGNHRDAWVFGAVDPNSGTASLLELARGLGDLLRRGWRPKRSIILGSWDAEEFGMVGSTEWVEDNLGMLGARAVAYVNVDCAVAGPGFFASATPQLDALLHEVTKQVKDPEGVYPTVFDAWRASSRTGAPEISRLGGGGSDFVSFLQHAGVPSLDLQFGDEFPVYHSKYDDYHWMEKFGDPLFHRHVAITSILGILTLRLADLGVLPFDYLGYAQELKDYTRVLENEIQSTNPSARIVLDPLHSAVDDLSQSASHIREEANVFQSFRPDANQFFYFLLRRRAINDRLMLAERAFLDPTGLPGSGRSWYRHLVYGPTSNNAYGSMSFPGVIDTLTSARTSGHDQDWKSLQHEIWRVSRAISGVSSILRGSLT